MYPKRLPQSWLKSRTPLSGHIRNRGGKLMRVCCKLNGRRWARIRYFSVSHLSNDLLTLSKISDAVKRYSYLLGQTELFKHFVDIKVRFVN
jgi:hypothetical protein